MIKEMNVDLAVLYLTKKGNKSDLEAFEAWLNANPDNREYYENWKEFWEASGNTYKTIHAETDKAWLTVRKNTVDKQISTARQRMFSATILKVAAAILVLISIGFIAGWLNKTGVLPGEHFIAYSSGADTLTVTLPDGTRVCLNKYSIVFATKYFKKHERKVYFNGEAYFDVSRDATRPFKIIAKSTTTEVLGTSFNLMAKTSDNNTRLTLIKGKVALYKNEDTNEKIILLPGQEGIYNASLGKFRNETIKDLNRLAWKTGTLQFNNAPLKELCKVLSAYYNTKIIYVERTIPVEGELFTGTFTNIKLEKALDIIKMTLNVNSIQNGDIIRIYYK